MIFLKNIVKKYILSFINFENNIIKFGIDSTYYSIHLGHLFLINFIFFFIYKKFEIIIIIGDFTASIKKNIDKKDIILNSICLKSQLNNILGSINIYFNSIWINKIKFNFFLKILNCINFNKYVNKNIKNELKFNFKLNYIIYPFFQSLDSLIFNSYIEFGGIDQLLNIICGRFLQNIFKKKKQNTILFIILEKKNKKISKTDNNFFINKELKNIDLFEKIFFNIKNLLNNFKKKNFFYLNFYNFFLLKKYNIVLYFKIKNFLSYFVKKIFNINKFIFNKFIYNKKIFLNNKVVVKNFFLKKMYYKLNNVKIIIYE